MLSLKITDFALADMVASLGSVPPEQGGAMLGVPGADVVTSFIHDKPAVVSQVRYHNSDWLIDEVARRERSGPERFKGVVHSHPHAMPAPSGQDCREFGESLRLNPELARYLAGIVTLSPEVSPGEHQLLLGGALFSFFGASWTGQKLRLMCLRPVVIPIDQSLSRAGFDPLAHRPVPVVADDSLVLGSRLQMPGIGAVTLLFGTDFPLVPPILLVGEPPRTVALAWDLALGEQHRLTAALAGLARHNREGPAPRGNRPRRRALPSSGWPVTPAIKDDLVSQASDAADERLAGRTVRGRIRSRSRFALTRLFQRLCKVIVARRSGGMLTPCSPGPGGCCPRNCARSAS